MCNTNTENGSNLCHFSEPDFALPALRRAAQAARQLAMDTNTDLIVAKNGKFAHIPPQELRRQQATGKSKKIAAIKESASCPAKN